MSEVKSKFVGAVIFTVDPRSGNVLIVGRKGYPDKLGVLPGGKLEAGETYREGAIRELFEETGLTPEWVSENEVFHGVALASNAPCSMFLGRMSEADWDRIGTEGFMGPEGLKVIGAPWHLAATDECPLFAEYNLRFLQHIQANPELKSVFVEGGLEPVYEMIKSYKF